MPDSGLVGRVLDELITRFGAAGHEAEVARARAEYEARRGRVFEDEEPWEAWTQAFLEWYVLERAAPAAAWPPAGLALAAESDPDRAAALRALLRSHRSLFEIRSLEPGRVELLDLVGGAEFAVDEQRALHGVVRGDVLEARLVGLGGRVGFTRTLGYHPPGTGAAIGIHVARLRAQGRDRLDILDFVASLRVKTLRYQNVPAEKVYEPDSRL